MNVITLDVYKNTIRKHDGFNPTESEKNYTQLLFRFQQDDEWAKCNIITASFFLSADEIVKSDAELLTKDLTSTFSIPTEFTGRRGTLFVGLQGIYSDGEENTTISTNIITIDRTKGTIIQEGTPQNLYEKLIVLWNKYVKQIDDEIIQKIDPTVIAYLAEHPELTTTVQDGAVTEIKLSDTLQLKKANYHKNVAEMIADENLIEGMTVVTLGYYSANDLGSAEYLIGKNGNIKLKNGLFAQIIIKPQMNVECFGAIGDKEDFDNSEAIEKASEYITQLMFSNKTYRICRTLNIQNGINWKGNETVFKLDDDFEVDQSLTACIYILGESIIEGITFEYESKYWINDFETTGRVYDENGNKIEYPHLTVVKVKAGENHVLKNVKLNVTENKATGVLPYGAEVAGIWYFFTDFQKHNLVVENCHINNLTTGHSTGTGCLWATGNMDNLIVKDSSFTRNHLGDVVTFWAIPKKTGVEPNVIYTQQTINNALVDNCVFNLTNDVYKKKLEAGAAALQFGASVTEGKQTLFNNIEVRDCYFNVGTGFGAPCIACATESTVINVNSCTFIKNYDNDIPDNEDDNVDYKKRLELLNLNSNSKAYVNNAFINNPKGMVYTCDLSSIHSTCIVYISNSNICSYSHIQSTSNAVYNNVNAEILTDYNIYKTMFQSPKLYLVDTVIKNCTFKCIFKSTSNLKVSLSAINEIWCHLQDKETTISIDNCEMENFQIVSQTITIDKTTGKTELLKAEKLSINNSRIENISSFIDEVEVDIKETVNELTLINNHNAKEAQLLSNIPIITKPELIKNGVVEKNKLSDPLKELLDSIENLITSGEGQLTPNSSQTSKINSATYEYQKIGNCVDVYVCIDFTEFTPLANESITLSGLPCSCINEVRGLCVTTKKNQLIWAIVQDTSSLTIIFNDQNKFTENEKLTFFIHYKGKGNEET